MLALYGSNINMHKKHRRAKSQEYSMYDVQVSCDLSDSVPRSSVTSRKHVDLDTQLEMFGEFDSDGCGTVEESSSMEEAKSIVSCNKHSYTHNYRLQLEHDVKRLQDELQKEIELHTVLENVVEHIDVSSSMLRSLPHNVKELLSTIAELESTVSKLDRKMVYLNLQLKNEKYERKLMECHWEHAKSSTPFMSSPEDTKRLKKGNSFIHDKRLWSKEDEHAVVIKDIAIKDLSYHPNYLSEQMVSCMAKIFICLANSSSSSKAHSSRSIPSGNHSHSLLHNLTTTSAVLQSPQFDSKSERKVRAKQISRDPYKVRGKLSWAEIGSYGSAVEISWMSVGKKQLEYAAVALRRYRSLVEQLAKLNLNHLSSNGKLAFWINIYNALIMHAYLAYGAPRNEVKFFSLMQKAAYTIGGTFFNAVSIEYGILKMKPLVYRPQIALLLALHKHKPSGEFHKFSIDTVEPLVAFALSSGMFSSPAIRVYTALNVRRELQEAQRDFIQASVGISSKRRLLVPKMLYCFAKEFVEDSGLTLWISRFLPPEQAVFIEHCMLQRKHKFLTSHNCAILPFDCHFRYLFLPDKISP